MNNYYVDELHNKEDAQSLVGSVLFFLGLALVLGTIGVVFWSAF